MKLIRSVFALLFLLAPPAGPARSARAATAHAWVCPPCHAPCDAKVFDHPGVCPQCGMALVEQAGVAAAPPHQRRKVAILVFNGVEIIDSMGPYEVFGAADYDVYTVAATPDPVTSAMGMGLVPKYTFANAPQPDVLVVPGGGVRAARDDARTLQWVRDVTAKDTHTMSVCNGAFILASAGLLDGLTATTTAGNIPRLTSEFPKIHVVNNQRYVDNGKIITTAGLSAGIDGALHVVARMKGEGAAQQVALSEEYAWSPGGGFTRAALADLLIPDVGHDIDDLGHWDIVRTHGDTERWELVLHGTSDLHADQILERIGRAFTTKGRWKAVGSAGRLVSRWSFAGRNGEPWGGTLVVAPDPKQSGSYTATLTLARAG